MISEKEKAEKLNELKKRDEKINEYSYSIQFIEKVNLLLINGQELCNIKEILKIEKNRNEKLQKDIEKQSKISQEQAKKIEQGDKKLIDELIEKRELNSSNIIIE